MKLDQEELELTLLKHLVSSPKALDKALGRKIGEEHFVFIEEGAKISYHASLFKLIKNYHEESGGSLLTQLVLEAKMVEHSLKDKTRGKFVTLWAKIEDIDIDPNDLHELLTQIKNRYCMRLVQSMFKEAHTTLIDDGLPACLTVIQDHMDEINGQINEFGSDQQSIDIALAAPYFETEYTKRRDHPEEFRGILCGLDEIDDKTFGWMPGQLIVLLAPSAGGKSVQLLNWALFANQMQGKNVLYFSFEMSLWLCLLRHLSLAFKVPYSSLKSITVPPPELVSLVDKMKGATDGAYFEYDVNMEDPTPEYIDSKIRELTATKGKPDLVVVDYIGNMTTRGSRRDAKPWERQGDAVEKLFILAKRYGLPILTAQQINRDTIRDNRKQKENGQATAYYQDAASGDQRLMHLAHFAIGMEPDKENSRTVYHPVKMRDAAFQPFAAQVDPEHNGIYALTPEEQAEWRIMRSENAGKKSKDDGSSSSGSIKRSPTKPTSPAPDTSYKMPDTTSDELEIDLDWSNE